MKRRELLNSVMLSALLLIGYVSASEADTQEYYNNETYNPSFEGVPVTKNSSQPCNNCNNCTPNSNNSIKPYAETNCAPSIKAYSNCNNCVKQPTSNCNNYNTPCAPVLKPYKVLNISVVGQGVAPNNTISPAQAYALAKRAAIADAYRLIAEKVKGVRVEGKDYIKNMIVKRSTIRTYVDAMIRNADIVDTTFKDGLCEVEMDIKLYYWQFAR